MVISIISLLIALLLPALGKAREAARTMQGLSNLRQIGVAAGSYANTYRQQLPPANIAGSYVTDVNPSATQGAWPQFLDGMMRGKDVVPAAELSNVFRCPNATLKMGHWHYSAPRRVMMQLGQASDKLYNLNSARRTSEIVLVADGTQNISVPAANATYARSGERFADSVSPLAPGNPNLAFFDPTRADINDPVFGSDEPNHENTGGTTNGLIRWRQAANNSANAAYLDGHAATQRMGSILNRNVRPDR